MRSVPGVGVKYHITHQPERLGSGNHMTSRRGEAHRHLVFCYGLLTVGVLVLTGCTERRTGESKPEITNLGGRWEIQLQESSKVEDQTVRGVLVLTLPPGAPNGCSSPDPNACKNVANGTHDADVAPILGYSIPRDVEGVVTSADLAVIRLGECCHHDEIMLEGAVGGDVIRGAWRADRMGEVKTGTFALQRSGQAGRE